MTSDSSHASPVAGTWYNKGGSLAIPIGRWRVEYAVELEVTRAATEPLMSLQLCLRLPTQK